MLRDSVAVKRYALFLFFGFSYLFTWLLLLPLLRIDNPLENTGLFLLYVFAGFGPSLAALLVTWLESGTAGVKTLLQRVIHRPQRVRWYCIAIILPLLVQLLSVGILLFTTELLFPLVTWSRWMLVGPYFVFNLFIFGALGEELGWRGFALARLQERYSALVASIIIGILWAIWFLPHMLIGSGGFGEIGLVWLAIQLIAISAIFAWIYNTTKSLMLVILAHASALTVSPIIHPILEASGYAASYGQIISTVYTNIAVIIILVCGAKTLVYKPGPKRQRPDAK